MNSLMLTESVGMVDFGLLGIRVPLSRMKLCSRFFIWKEFFLKNKNHKEMKQIIPEKEIVYAEADGSYTVIHYLNNEKNEIISKNIGAVEKNLCERSKNFFRIQRKYLINLAQIHSLSYPIRFVIMHCVILLNQNSVTTV